MSEEEIIKYLESYIQFFSVLKAPEPQDAKMMKAVKGIIDLYNKEKEKNKKIKDGILFVGRRNGKDAEQKMILDEYIRKDKIKEILKKDRDCMSLGYYSAYIGLIDDIQELLYEE